MLQVPFSWIHSFWKFQAHSREGKTGGRQNQGAKREHSRSNTVVLVPIFCLGTLPTRDLAPQAGSTPGPGSPPGSGTHHSPEADTAALQLWGCHPEHLLVSSPLRGGFNPALRETRGLPSPRSLPAVNQSPCLGLLLLLLPLPAVLSSLPYLNLLSPECGLLGWPLIPAQA